MAFPSSPLTTTRTRLALAFAKPLQKPIQCLAIRIKILYRLKETILPDLSRWNVIQNRWENVLCDYLIAQLLTADPWLQRYENTRISRNHPLTLPQRLDAQSLAPVPCSKLEPRQDFTLRSFR